MQHVAVVKDGRVVYYAADGDALVEYARVLVPDEFSAESAAALGLNIVGATGLGDRGPAPVAPTPEARALPAAPRRPGRPSAGTATHYELVAQQVALHPGATVVLLAGILGWHAKSVGNALQIAKAHGLVRRDPGRGWFAVRR